MAKLSKEGMGGLQILQRRGYIHPLPKLKEIGTHVGWGQGVKGIEVKQLCPPPSTKRLYYALKGVPKPHTYGHAVANDHLPHGIAEKDQKSLHGKRDVPRVYSMIAKNILAST